MSHPSFSKFISFLKWRVTNKAKKWPRFVQNPVFSPPPAKVSDDALRATFVGHSSFLLQTGGINILTDPVWSQKVGPFNLIGPKRISPPGIAWEHLPKIDVVLVSHDHYDHLDISTLKKLYLRDRPHIVVPHGVNGLPFPVETVQWNDSISTGITLHFEPALHWSGRSLWNHGKTLWGAFVLDTSAGKIYFAGDTAYGEGNHFRSAFEKHGPFSLALLPIGAYEPRWFMQHAHMNPEEAVLAHKDLGAPPTLAMHYATFRLSDEGYDTPLTDLESALSKHSIPSENFSALEIGGSKMFSAIPKSLLSRF